MGVNEHWWGSPSTGLVPGLHPEGLDKAGKPPIRVCGGTVTLKPAWECLPMPRSLLHSHRRRKPFLEGEHSAPSGALCAYLSAPVHAILGPLWVSHGSQPLVLSRLELIWGLQHAVPGKERSSSGSSVRGKKHRSVSVAPAESPTAQTLAGIRLRAQHGRPRAKEKPGAGNIFPNPPEGRFADRFLRHSLRAALPLHCKRQNFPIPWTASAHLLSQRLPSTPGVNMCHTREPGAFFSERPDSFWESILPS